MLQLSRNVPGANEGSLKYKKNVVLQIIELATKEIAGVASLSSHNYLNITGSSAKKRRGMVVSYLEEGIVIDIFINILFGYSVNDVAFRIQENVKRSVESMTDYKVKHINVHVPSVLFENNEGKIVT